VAVLHRPRALQRLQEKEPQSGQLLSDADRLQLAIREEVGLIPPNVFQAQSIWRSLEILRELLDGTKVNTSGDLRHIPTLEFLRIAFRSWVTGTSL
jgi:hypothetical protein